MKVFKVKKGSKEFISLTENNFIEATDRKRPFYQGRGGETKHYAYCPACNNPAQIINLHVKKDYVDEKKKSISRHARHVKRDIEGIGEYDQSAYDACPYANPSSSLSKEKRPVGDSVANEILGLITKYPDVIEIVLKRDLGISLPEELFKKMLMTFKSEEGHLYKYCNKFNIPYAFAYMADSQNLMYAKLDYNTKNIVGYGIFKAIRDKSKWCFVNQLGQVRRKGGIKERVNVTFHFSSFEYEEVDGEKYQKFTIIIKEALADDSYELFRAEVKFDQFYYYNLVNKRERYIEAVSGVYR